MGNVFDTVLWREEAGSACRQAGCQVRAENAAAGPAAVDSQLSGHLDAACQGWRISDPPLPSRCTPTDAFRLLAVAGPLCAGSLAQGTASWWAGGLRRLRLSRWCHAVCACHRRGRRARAALAAAVIFDLQAAFREGAPSSAACLLASTQGTLAWGTCPAVRNRRPGWQE